LLLKHAVWAFWLAADCRLSPVLRHLPFIFICCVTERVTLHLHLHLLCDRKGVCRQVVGGGGGGVMRGGCW
jgi:hypothetical protein